ncbi:MAG: hypothetical protein O3A78_08865 [Nitrospinae bacterium]|nr:hypothetical protein [Nitrospinota bacterium]MDA1109904.1 hypothetical protein [Nitrospinota bacterium]
MVNVVVRVAIVIVVVVDSHCISSAGKRGTRKASRPRRADKLIIKSIVCGPRAVSCRIVIEKIDSSLYTRFSNIKNLFGFFYSYWLSLYPAKPILFQQQREETEQSIVELRLQTQIPIHFLGALMQPIFYFSALKNA